MLSNKIKIMIGSIAGIFVLLFLVLSAPIAFETRQTSLEKNAPQLARIDFEEPMDAAKVSAIQKELCKLDGVGKATFHPKGSFLTYSVDVSKISESRVYHTLMSKVHCEARPFAVPQEVAYRTVTDKKSFTSKVSHTIDAIVH